MPSQFKALLFDMDGVVIDTHASVEHYWNQLADTHNVTLTVEDFERHIHGTQSYATLDRYFSMLGQEEIDSIAEDILVYEDHLSYSLMPGIYDFLSSLKENGVLTALVTSGTQRKVDAVFGQFPLLEKFDDIVTADLVQQGKPDPECYALAAERLGVPSGDCIVFEDSRSGAQAALSAGAQVIGVGKTDMLLELGAMQIIPNFEDMAIESDGEKLSLHVMQSERYCLHRHA